MQLKLLLISLVFCILLLGTSFNSKASALNELIKLTASDGATFDFFGQGVSIFCDKIVVGAFRDDDVGENSGAIYLYNLSAPDVLSSEIKLTASDAVEHANFGQDVSIAGDKLVVGAKGDVIYNQVPPGAAYVYDLSAPDVLASEIKLTASDGAPNDHFGYSASIAEDKIVVGSIRSDDVMTTTGAAYVYDLSAPDVLASEIKLTASDGAPNDHFGNTVYASGHKIVVGAYRDDDKGQDSGAVYVYVIDFGNDDEASQINSISSCESKSLIPKWIKNNARWWSENTIDDATFVSGIKYLIEQKIMNIPNIQNFQPEYTLPFVDVEKDAKYYIDRYYHDDVYRNWFDSNFPEYTIEEAVGLPSDPLIPDWVKNNAKLWTEDTITDKDFLNGIEFLIKNGIILI